MKKTGKPTAGKQAGQAGPARKKVPIAVIKEIIQRAIRKLGRPRLDQDAGLIRLLADLRRVKPKPAKRAKRKGRRAA